MAENKEVVDPEIPDLSSSEAAELAALLTESGHMEKPTDEPDDAAEGEGVEGEVEAVDGDEQPEETAEATTDEELEAAEETPAEDDAAEEDAEAEPPPEDEKIAKGLRALAARDRKLREREQELARKERDLSSEISSLKTATAALRKLAIEDPAAFYASLGEKKTARIAADLFYAEHPDQAPPEHRERKSVAALERRVEQMQELIANRDRQSSEAAERQNAISFLRSVATTLPDNLPFLKAEAEENPASVAHRMFDTMIRMRDDGRLAGIRGDKNIAAAVAKELNKESQILVERVRKIWERANKKKAGQGPPSKPGTKTPPPAAEEIKTAPSRVVRKSTALTRPRRSTSSHEEDIAKVIEDARAGRIR